MPSYLNNLYFVEENMVILNKSEEGKENKLLIYLIKILI